MMPSIKPANVGDKQYYINLMNIYLPSLSKMMDVTLVTPHLASLRLLKLGKRHSYSHFIKHTVLADCSRLQPTDTPT